MPNKIIKASQKLVDALKGLTFSDPITHTYNPLEYAWDPHKIFLEKFATGKKKVLFMGMNPGPYGMAQTGVPFGEISMVADWMKINTLVSPPENEHPKRPIQGFGCPKSEVSGRRLWGYFAKLYPDANDFFKDHYLTNYCPLVWMAETGRNITPDKVSKKEIAKVDAACDEFLAEVISLLEPKYLIGVGAYAEKKLSSITEKLLPGESFTIGKVLHPSPASPAANRGWEEAAEKQLIELLGEDWLAK